MDDLQYTVCENLGELIGKVLNLVINGWPSILLVGLTDRVAHPSFKPCYKWMTFNTSKTLKKWLKKGYMF